MLLRGHAKRQVEQLGPGAGRWREDERRRPRLLLGGHVPRRRGSKRELQGLAGCLLLLLLQQQQVPWRPRSGGSRSHSRSCRLLVLLLLLLLLLQ
jgi:hypothetical protein